MRQAGTAFLIATLAGAPAVANDSTAELSTGGLVLVRTPSVEMRSEDLYLSAREVRVRYRFFNGSDQDVSTLVAFPMPDITINLAANIAIPTEDPRNILAFTTVANGKPVATRVEQKVFAKDVDRTDLLGRLGIPLAPHLAATRAALDRLPPDTWQEFIDTGLAEIEEYDRGMKQYLDPRWTLKTTYYWQQTFPARHEVVVEHRYSPSVGQSRTELGDQTFSGLAEYQRTYCIDPDFMAAVAKWGTERAVREQRIRYILTTGANWASPVADFTLVVDKGDPKNLISFCAEGVKKIAATQFEVHKTNFVPRSDLAILILQRAPFQE